MGVAFMPRQKPDQVAVGTEEANRRALIRDWMLPRPLLFPPHFSFSARFLPHFFPSSFSAGKLSVHPPRLKGICCPVRYPPSRQGLIGRVW